VYEGILALFCILYGLAFWANGSNYTHMVSNRLEVVFDMDLRCSLHR